MEGPFKIPECIFQHAILYVKSRVKANQKHYEQLWWKRRNFILKNPILFDGPIEGDFYTDFKGILAELLVRHRMDLTGQNFTASAFVKEKGNNDPDLIVNEKTIDIKGCEKSLKVNLQSLSKINVDYIVFVLYLRDKHFVVYKFKKSDISKWDIVTVNKNNQYYEYKIDKRKWRHQIK